jgi:hypothetical protein
MIEAPSQQRSSPVSMREALKAAREWAQQIANDERVQGWVHEQDYGLYCLLADCPVDFDATLSQPVMGEEENLIARLKHCCATMTNDDMSAPQTNKRSRQVERVDTILSTIEFLERLSRPGLDPETVERVAADLARVDGLNYPGLAEIPCSAAGKPYWRKLAEAAIRSLSNHPSTEKAD